MSLANIEIDSHPSRLRDIPDGLEAINTNNWWLFHGGFNKELVVEACANEEGVRPHCPLCNQLPRVPRQLRCKHFFCKSCIIKSALFELNNRKFNGHRDLDFMRLEIRSNGDNPKVHCPICKQMFRLRQMKDFHNFDEETKKILLAAKVRCPNGCGFIGHPAEVNQHLYFYCGLRIISCPNRGCYKSGPANDMSSGHFQSCREHRFFCKICELPVYSARAETHNCISLLKERVRKFDRHVKDHHRMDFFGLMNDDEAMNSDDNGSMGSPGKTAFFSQRRVVQDKWDIAKNSVHKVDRIRRPRESYRKYPSDEEEPGQVVKNPTTSTKKRQTESSSTAAPPAKIGFTSPEIDPSSSKPVITVTVTRNEDGSVSRIPTVTITYPPTLSSPEGEIVSVPIAKTSEAASLEKIATTPDEGEALPKETITTTASGSISEASGWNLDTDEKLESYFEATALAKSIANMSLEEDEQDL